MIAVACAAVFMAAGVGLVVGIVLGRRVTGQDHYSSSEIGSGYAPAPFVLDLDAVRAAGDRAELRIRAAQLARSGPRHVARPRLQLVMS